MLDERKNVIDSIAKFKIQQPNSRRESLAAPAPVGNDTVDEKSVETAPLTQDSTTEKMATAPIGYANILLMVSSLLLILALFWLNIYQQSAADAISQTENSQTENSDKYVLELANLKTEIGQLQQTMSSIIDELQVLTHLQQDNRVKQQQVRDYLTAADNDHESAELDPTMAQITQQTAGSGQPQPAVESPVDENKVAPESINGNSANTVEQSPGEVAGIKSQQLKIQAILLQLQQEYIKLNQIQVNQVPQHQRTSNEGKLVDEDE